MVERIVRRLKAGQKYFPSAAGSPWWRSRLRIRRFMAGIDASGDERRNSRPLAADSTVRERESNNTGAAISLLKIRIYAIVFSGFPPPRRSRVRPLTATESPARPQPVGENSPLQIGVGPSGRTGREMRIDARFGLLKDESDEQASNL